MYCSIWTWYFNSCLVKGKKGYPEAVRMLATAVELCFQQLCAGRWFVFAHPLLASSWQQDCLCRLARAPGVMVAEFHMCQFGLRLAK